MLSFKYIKSILQSLIQISNYVSNIRIRKKREVVFKTFPPSLRVGIIILQKSEIVQSEKHIMCWSETSLRKIQIHEFSPIQGSSLLGKSMEYWNMTALPVYF